METNDFISEFQEDLLNLKASYEAALKKDHGDNPYIKIVGNCVIIDSIQVHFCLW